MRAECPKVTLGKETCPGRLSDSGCKQLDSSNMQALLKDLLIATGNCDMKGSVPLSGKLSKSRVFCALPAAPGWCLPCAAPLLWLQG